MSASHVDHENPFAGQGAVMLDIGGDIGALVVEMPAEMLGVEIEIRPAGATSDGAGHTHYPHVAVVERPAAGGPMPSLVFGELTEGTYQLTDKGGDEVLATATVRGNEVTDMVWPERQSSTSRHTA
jgi:hypothetical protein